MGLTPRVSVLVPLYNKAPYVGRCVESVLAQSLPDFEVMVVDDGSTDGGLEVAQAYARDPRVRILSQPNAGPGAARNRAAREARADLLAPLDADDAWDPDYLSESVRLMNVHGPETACLTWAIMELPMGVSSATRWRKAGIPEGRYRVSADTDPRLVVAFLANMLPSSTVFRTSVFLEEGGFYDKFRCLFSEDAYLFLRILMRHQVAFSFRSPVRRHCDASELALNAEGVRPVEPFLLEGEDMYAGVAPELHDVLGKVLSIRAFKTVGVLGYFGEYMRAREIFRRFRRKGDWRLPHYPLALLGCTPLARWAGAVARLTGIPLRAIRA